ncbi:aspartate/glutamate racemase family protein [Elongatibacter sediminis]|uniref:Aspartate/glutamate racemase family protein n=1 Tax=Elongatibacter sediminis TaxID=3119006 RepID=A0AAW9RDX3_9GAMM
MQVRVLEAFVVPEPELQALAGELRTRYGRDDLDLSVAAPARPPEVEAHESMTALSYAVPELVRNALEAEAEGIDGLMVDCMADPGIEVLRETVSIPVLGPGITSMQVATLLGRRFSLLVTTDFSSRYFHEYARRTRLNARLASCRQVDIPPEQLQAESGHTLQALTEAAVQAVESDGADTLILCCTGFAPFSARLGEALDARGLSVPLIDPFAVTLNALAMLIHSGLSHSGIAFPATAISAQHRH